ncbi:MAG: hypothetical protein D4S02_16590 [Rhodocyclaceae bacterium]|nr:MAG: hypothetical protein D4S02_16590 [Rhodocyclaceae bacterium]
MAESPLACAGGNGMTLCGFDKNTAQRGNSSRSGTCATGCPPLSMVEGGAAPNANSVETRDHGMKQWAFKGKPLYCWVKDWKRGGKTGDAFNSVWHIAKS